MQRIRSSQSNLHSRVDAEARQSTTRAPSILLCIMLLACFALFQTGCRQKSADHQASVNAGASRYSTTSGEVDSRKTAAEIDRFCGDCHATPPPSGFPRSDWQQEVENGFKFYLDSGRTDLEMPVLNDVLRHYQSLAPQSLALPDQIPVRGDWVERFRTTRLRTDVSADQEPVMVEATAHVKFLDLPGQDTPVLVSTGLRSGKVCVSAPDGSSVSVLARLSNPAQFSHGDLDGDGFEDLIIADLGSFKPLDHQEGKVVWLRWNEQSQQFDKHVILESLGRTADVQPGDFDGDGDLDLVVAEFGWEDSGGVHLMINQGKAQPGATVPLIFETTKIDGRHGPINVPVVDLDQDGDLDFVLLLGQEYESIVFFDNQGNNQFRKRTLYAAGDPSFGSSGLQPVDIDKDGDLDFLYANGDAFDRFFIKPYHGVRLLENRGNLSFSVHHLGYMAGAHRAMPIDFDNDDDLDIVAVSCTPEMLNKSQAGIHNSVVLFRNIGELQFEAGAIQKGESTHSTVTVGDFDGDGDSDFATGDRSATDEDSQLSIWWNSGSDNSANERQPK